MDIQYVRAPEKLHYYFFIGLKMSEAHFDEFEHYNYDQDKNMMSGHSGNFFLSFEFFFHDLLISCPRSIFFHASCFEIKYIQLLD